MAKLRYLTTGKMIVQGQPMQVPKLTNSVYFGLPDEYAAQSRASRFGHVFGTSHVGFFGVN